MSYPVSPATFDAAAYTSASLIVERSIFTDHGPIARPPLTIRSGTGASLVDAVTVNLPAGLLAADVIGRYLKLTGSTNSDGDYLVTSVLSPT